jgi:hypothetical protein
VRHGLRLKDAVLGAEQAMNLVITREKIGSAALQDRET